MREGGFEVVVWCCDLRIDGQAPGRSSFQREAQCNDIIRQNPDEIEMDLVHCLPGDGEQCRNGIQLG